MYESNTGWRHLEMEMGTEGSPDHQDDKRRPYAQQSARW